MSKNISAWYEDNEVDPQDLLGTQNISIDFWELPILITIGIKRLNELGH